MQSQYRALHYNASRGKKLLTIFGTNITDTTGHQMAIQVPTSPNICFYTNYLGKREETKHALK